MSKLIAEFPSDDRKGKARISISLGGVEIVVDRDGQLNLDPVETRTLATLLMHASNEAEMMKRHHEMDEEWEKRRDLRPDPPPVRKPGS